MKELPKVYEPQQVESSIYEMWMENDCFKAEPLANERLMHCEKLSMTPHIGAATSEAQQRIGELTVDIIQEVLGK